MNANGKTKDPLPERIGDYKVIDLIGEGGMGKVFKAFDPTLKRWVAIKVLSEEFRNNPEVAERFHQEAEVASRLVHPNLLSIIQYGHDKEGDLLYIVSELLAGEDLENVLQAGQPLPFERIKRIMTQVLEALAAAHRFGIVHRDLKPGNVFLMEAPLDHVKILDFGLAKIIDVAGVNSSQKLTQEGKVFGTPKYMSPEQVTAKKVDHRTDIYSAGVILYELITGTPLFVGETSQETMYMHVRDGVKSPRELRKDCPPVLARVVLKALEKEPDNRFASARAFKDALEEAFEKPVERVSIVDSIASSLENLFSLGKKSQAGQVPLPPGVPNGDSSAISTEFAPTISASSMPNADKEKKAEEKQPEAEPAKKPEAKAEEKKPEAKPKPAPKPRTPKKFWYGVVGVVAAAVLLACGIGYFSLSYFGKRLPPIVPGMAGVETVPVSKQPVSKQATQVAPAEEWKLHFETGIALEKEKRWKEAATEFQKAVELSPKQADIWKRLGGVRLKLGKKEAAAEAYREYLKLRPDAPDAPYIEGLIKKW